MLIKRTKFNSLQHEYGLEGQRLLPWGDNEFPFPFGGAYCIVRAGTKSLEHVNSPDDEVEMFICISGKALLAVGESGLHEVNQGDIVYISPGEAHYLKNPFKDDFHFYALWWNSDIVNGYSNFKARACQNTL
ncbi:MAG: cupin domain-containing protein [Sphingobacteriales bacterium]|nr:MAG: cupin domain-containing protein [Sphingobacteriales bacterium]